MTLISMVMLSVALGTTQAQPPQKPVVDAPVVYDYPVPDTLGEFMEQADTVVVARLKGARDLSHGNRPRTDYELDVTSVLKEHRNLGSDPTVCRPIGVTEQPNRIVRRFQPGFPAFSPDSEYLLFLAWNEADRCFYTAFGPAGVGVVDAVTGLKPLTRHQALGQLDGLNVAGIVARVAALPKRR